MREEKELKWDQFHELTESMENIEKKQIPGHFTANVMVHLPQVDKTFFKGGLFSTNLTFGLGNTVTRTECAFYFFLTGFFYFVLGLIMMIGFPLSSIALNNSWLSLQPVFGIFLAFELMILGIVLYVKGSAAVRFVRGGTIFFTILILMNTCIGAIYIHPAAAVFFMAFFSATGLVLAILLGIAIDHYHPENIFSEARG